MCRRVANSPTCACARKKRPDPRLCLSSEVQPIVTKGPPLRAAGSSDDPARHGYTQPNRGRSSAVERQLPKLNVRSSILLARFARFPACANEFFVGADDAVFHHRIAHESAEPTATQHPDHHGPDDSGYATSPRQQHGPPIHSTGHPSFRRAAPARSQNRRDRCNRARQGGVQCRPCRACTSGEHLLGWAARRHGSPYPTRTAGPLATLAFSRMTGSSGPIPSNRAAALVNIFAV